MEYLLRLMTLYVTWMNFIHYILHIPYVVHGISRVAAYESLSNKVNMNQKGGI